MLDATASQTVPAGIFPGERMMHGTRWPPSQVQAACVGDGFGFMVEVKQDFRMIRNETDRDHDNVRPFVLSRELPEPITDVWFQPGLARCSTAALVCQ